AAAAGGRSPGRSRSRPRSSAGPARRERARVAPAPTGFHADRVGDIACRPSSALRLVSCANHGTILCALSEPRIRTWLSTPVCSNPITIGTSDPSRLWLSLADFPRILDKRWSQRQSCPIKEGETIIYKEGRPPWHVEFTTRRSIAAMLAAGSRYGESHITGQSSAGCI